MFLAAQFEVVTSERSVLVSTAVTELLEFELLVFSVSEYGTTVFSIAVTAGVSTDSAGIHKYGSLYTAVFFTGGDFTSALEIIAVVGQGILEVDDSLVGL